MSEKGSCSFTMNSFRPESASGHVRSGYRTLATEFYEEIKNDVITCKLMPGEMITQKVLAERYGASKTPLREALKLLTQEGLIQPLPSRGYLVAPISVEDVRELFDVRQVLEMAAVERAVRFATEEQFAALERLVGEPDSLRSGETAVRWYMGNLEFHVFIGVISGNDHLAHLLRYVLQDLSRALILDWNVDPDPEPGVRAHTEIVEALRKRDAQLAKSALLKHIGHSLESIRESLAFSELGDA